MHLSLSIYIYIYIYICIAPCSEECSSASPVMPSGWSGGRPRTRLRRVLSLLGVKKHLSGVQGCGV